MSYYRKFSKRIAFYRALLPWPTFLLVTPLFFTAFMRPSLLTFLLATLLSVIAAFVVVQLANKTFYTLATAYRDKLLATIREQDRPDDAQQNWQRQSAFLLLLQRGSTLTGAGTAFAWDSHTLVTCAHCVPADCTLIVISHADGRQLYVEQVYKHPGLDLAFIRLRKAHDYPLLLRAEEPLAADTPLWTLDFRYKGCHGTLALLALTNSPMPPRLNTRYPLHLGYSHPPEAFDLTEVGKIRSDVALMAVYGGMSGSPVMQGSHAVGMLFAGGEFMCAFVPMRLIAKAAASLPPVA